MNLTAEELRIIENALRCRLEDTLKSGEFLYAAQIGVVLVKVQDAQP